MGTTLRFDGEQAIGTVTTTANVGNVNHVMLDAVDGVVYSTQDHSVKRIRTNSTSAEMVVGSGSPGTANGVGSSAAFDVPFGIAQGIRNRNLLFVAEYGNNCLRRVDLPSRTVSTLAGVCGPAVGSSDGIGAVARFSRPHGVAIALVYNSASSTTAYEMLYVADRDNAWIRRVSVATGEVPSIPVTGFYPTDVAIVLDPLPGGDGGGVVKWFLAADFFHKVIRVDALGAWTTLVASGISAPYGITVAPAPTAVGGIVVLFTDTGNCAIRQVTMSGVVTTLSGQLGCGLADGLLSSARFRSPRGLRFYNVQRSKRGGVCVGEHGLLVADYTNFVVRRLVLNSSAAPCGTETPSLTMSFSVGRLSRSVSASASQQLSGSAWTNSNDRTSTVSLTSLASASRSASGSRSSPSCSASVAESATQGITGSEHTATQSSSMTRSSTTALSNTLTLSRTTTRSRTISAQTTISGSVSPSWWECGSLEMQNASLGVPDTLPTQSNRTGRRVVVLQPTERPHPHRPSVPADTAIVLESMPVPRTALLWTAQEPVPLLELRLHPAWEKMLRWKVVSARSLLHDNAALDYIEELRNGRMVTLHPLLASRLGWLPGNVVMTESTWIMIALGLACAAEGGNMTGRTATVVVAIPAPGAAPVMAEEVATAVMATQWTTAVGGPGAGSAIGRVGAVRSIVLCGADGNGDDTGGPSGGGLLGVALASGSACSSTTASARGAVAGNGGIIACGAVIVALLTVAYTKARYVLIDKITLRLATLRLGVPSVILPVWVATLPSTATASAELLLGHEGTMGHCPTDVALGLLGSSICILPIAWICFVSFRLVPLLGLRPVDRPTLHTAPSPPDTMGCRGWRSCSVVMGLRAVVRRRVVWVLPTGDAAHVEDAHRRHTDGTSVDTSMKRSEVRGPVDGLHEDADALHDSTDMHRSRQAQVLLHEYRVLPYAAADVAVLVVSGVLSAGSGVGSHRLCVGAGATVSALYGLQLIVCAVVRPFTSTFAFVHALMTLVLSCVSVLLQVVAMVAAAGGDAASLEKLELLTLGAAACDLCVLGVSGVRVVVDIAGTVVAVRHVLQDLPNRSRVEQPLPNVESIVHNSEAAQPTVSPIDAKLWNSDGDADSTLDDALMREDDDDPLAGVVDHSRTALPLVDDDTASVDAIFWDADGNAVLPTQTRLSDADASLPEGLLGIIGGGSSPLNDEECCLT